MTGRRGPKPKEINPALVQNGFVQHSMWEMEYTCTMCARMGEKDKPCIFCGGVVMGKLEHNL